MTAAYSPAALRMCAVHAPLRRTAIPIHHVIRNQRFTHNDWKANGQAEPPAIMKNQITDVAPR
jgi:hypothetical protein